MKYEQNYKKKAKHKDTILSRPKIINKNSNLQIKQLTGDVKYI